MATVYDVFSANAAMLRALARTGVSLEDVNNIQLYEEFNRLSSDGLKTAYIIAHLCDEYAVSDRTVWRIVNKYRRIVNE